MTYRLGRRDLLTLLSLGGPAILASQASALDQTGVGKVGSGKHPAHAQGLCLNEDNSHFFFNGEGHGFDAKALDAWVDQYAHTQVRELMLCPNAMRTSYGSKVWTPIWKGLDPQAGPDQPLFASLPPEQRPAAWQFAHNAWKLDHDGIDVYKRWINRARKWGISPWISMRMNDVHCVYDEHHYFHSDFWRQNPQFRRVNYRFSPWTDRAFDYGHPEVRKYHMALVRELAERYDFDGLELDWMRFGFHFRPGHEAEGVGAADGVHGGSPRPFERLAKETRPPHSAGCARSLAAANRRRFGNGCRDLGAAGSGGYDCYHAILGHH